MKIIDKNTWGRRTHFEFFKRMDYPHYNMTVNIDITKFLKMAKARDLSFYYAMIYAATFALNKVEAFCYRIRGEEIVLHDKIHPSFTDMAKDSELFKMVTADMEDSLDSFVIHAKKKSEEQKDYFVGKDVEGRDDLIFITCIPWVSFTHLSHTISFNKDDSVPRLAWGKYFKDGDKILLPFSVQAHHSFVDGYHMGKYIETLQDYLNSFSDIKNI